MRTYEERMAYKKAVEDYVAKFGQYNPAIHRMLSLAEVRDEALKALEAGKRNEDWHFETPPGVLL